jgi:thiamine-phosphate pyrophosphorylase
MNARRPRPRLYLFTPLIDDAGSFAPRIGAAVAAADVAAVLLRLGDADARALIDRTSAIAPAVQSREVALVVEGRPEIAARAGADGAHLSGVAALKAALGVLKPGRIAGAGGLRSRHDAMLAGETEADYVLFGEPDRRGARPPFAALLERIAWWAELFEVPCVAYAARLDEVAPLAAAGADFVALGDWIWAEEPVAAIAAAGRLAATA